MPETVVLVAHPQMRHSRVNRLLMRSAAALAGPRLVLRDLYALYPDYLIDIEAEQALLAEARLVVWQYPTHWYSMPPLLKLWIDEVLGFGWAYGPGGRALRGKDLWVVTSTGGPEASYRHDGHNRHAFDDFLLPCVQTAALTGMRWLPPLVLHGAHRAEEAELQAHAAVYADRLATHPHWPEIADLEAEPQCQVPADARPAA